MQRESIRWLHYGTSEEGRPGVCPIWLRDLGRRHGSVADIGIQQPGPEGQVKEQAVSGLKAAAPSAGEVRQAAEELVALGLVTEHDFSRAVNCQSELGFSPWGQLLLRIQPIHGHL